MGLLATFAKIGYWVVPIVLLGELCLLPWLLVRRRRSRANNRWGSEAALWYLRLWRFAIVVVATVGLWELCQWRVNPAEFDLWNWVVLWLCAILFVIGLVFYFVHARSAERWWLRKYGPEGPSY
jgi:hypothetical protein